ncbi:hypothetical protein BFP72_03435 [Reichenbachiella sp. 5M10]|uniref:aminotransferase class IV n=1 Tax=Reichenbachiella sp. 5M10 TaxID=1889772 RepID=UPI000C14AAE8|nr:aminotransferase class IV [Reichenbachiella sp. 5M10]PIB34529.1 hypothetical protein BFP72_03435 [Reichenbachiella sp. 5M10]
MCQYIESICYRGGRPESLALHQSRMNRTFAVCYPGVEPHDLTVLLPEIPDHQRFKCRVLYDASEIYVEFIEYFVPQISTLRVVHSDDIVYSLKAIERGGLTRAYDQRGEADDVLIVRDGYVTDSYFANLAFYDGEKWVTPDTCLLEGVKRSSLLEQGMVEVQPIRLSEVMQFEKVSLINAMLNLGEVEINVNGIILN